MISALAGLLAMWLLFYARMVSSSSRRAGQLPSTTLQLLEAEEEAQ